MTETIFSFKELEKQLKKEKNPKEFHNLLIKQTCLVLALEHKLACRNPDCGVVLIHLRELLDNAKIKVARKEEQIFL